MNTPARKITCSNGIYKADGIPGEFALLDPRGSFIRVYYFPVDKKPREFVAYIFNCFDHEQQVHDAINDFAFDRDI